MTTSTVRIVFRGDTGSATSAVGKLDDSFSRLGRTAKIAAAAVTTGFAVALGAAVKQAISFDKEMRNVNSLIKLSETRFQALSKQVLGLSKSTGQGPATLAKGLYDIVSSGFKAGAALKILRASAIAATAGMTDTATASKAVVSILNAYKLGADQARNVSSLLFKEVQLGVNTFEELATNIGDTVPLAAALKIPFSDVAAGLALITTNGTSMAEASTQMSRVMADILKPSKELQATLKGMGYESGQAAIQAHGFVPLIKQLSDAAGDSASKTSDWFGNIRSLRGMLNLTGPNLQKFNQFAREMAASFKEGGDDLAAFNEQSKSIAVQWQKAKAALAAAAIPIGHLLFPALSKAAGALAGFAGWITKLNAAPDLGSKLGVFASGFRDLADDVQEAFDRILHGYEVVGVRGASFRMPGLGDQIAEAFEGADWNRVGQAIAEGVSLAVRRSAELAQALAGAIREAINRVDWVATGRVLGPGLAAAVVVGFATLTDLGFWVKNWDLALAVGLTAFGGVFGRLGVRLGAFLVRPFARIGAQAGQALVDGLETIVLKIADRLPAALSGIFLRGVALAGRALSSLGRLAGSVADNVLEKFSALWDKIGPFLRFTLKVIGITSAINAVSDFGTRAVHAIGGLAGGAVEKLGALLARVPGWVRTAFDIGPVGRLVGAVQKVVDLVQWLLKQAGKIIRLGISINWPSPPSWFGKLNPFRRAGGGFIPHVPGSVSGTDSVPAMLTPGEIVLNRGQQDTLGGPRFLAQLFGFSGDRGTHFAAGGIVPSGAGRRAGPRGPSPTRPRRPRRARPYQGLSRAAQGALRAVTRVYDRQTELDRTFSQLDRFYNISSEEFVIVDAEGNETLDPAAITRRLAEIDSLVGNRARMLDLLNEETAALQDAIAALERAIEEVLAEMRREQAQAREDERRVRQLRQELRASEDEERKVRAQKPKTKPQREEQKRAIARLDREQAQLDRQITTTGASRTQHLKRAGDLKTSAGDFRKDITRVRSGLREQRFDWRDVELTILEYHAEADAIRRLRPSAPFGGGDGGGFDGGGGDGGGGGAGGIDEEALRKLGLGKLAGAIEIAQLKVIGSFQKGTIHVPQTGPYQLHAGEQVVPAGVKSFDGQAPAPQVVVIMEPDEAGLSRYWNARLVEASDAINARFGLDAERRRREGRY